MPISSTSKTVPTKTALTKTASLQGAPRSAAKSQSGPGSLQAGEASESASNAGILEPLQDATFIFTTDLHGMITACNQPEGSDAPDRCAFLPVNLVGRNVADFSVPAQPMVFPSQAIALVLEKGRFQGALRCRTNAGQHFELQ